MTPQKPKSLVCHEKTPSWSKTISIELTPKLCSLSSSMVTYPMYINATFHDVKGLNT